VTEVKFCGFGSEITAIMIGSSPSCKTATRCMGSQSSVLFHFRNMQCFVASATARKLRVKIGRDAGRTRQQEPRRWSPPDLPSVTVLAKPLAAQVDLSGHPPAPIFTLRHSGTRSRGLRLPLNKFERKLPGWLPQQTLFIPP